MAHSNIVPYQNIPPRLLPQKRALFDRLFSCEWQRQLPAKYEKVARALTTASFYKVDLKSVIDYDKNRQTWELYELALLTFNHKGQIDYLLRKFYILENCPFLDKWLAKVLIAEMIWGKQQILSNSNEVEAIRYYEEDLRESFVEVMNIFRNPLNLNVSTSLPVYVRINLLCIPLEEALRGFSLEGWNLLPHCETYLDHLQKLGYLCEGNFMRDFHVPELFVFPPGTSFYNHPGYLSGKLVLQDKGSCMVSALLNPQPGSTVLDLFAAPGLKTNHVANVMNNNGTIYANDIHPERYITMRKIMDLTNSKCVQPLQSHYMDIKDCNYTYIIVDPSCSYSGIFWKKTKADQNARIKEYNSLLTEALIHILKNFKSAQRIIYTTCSIFPEEGEKVIDDALKKVRNSFILLDLKEILWNDWMNFGSTDYKCGNKCLRTVPEIDLCHGYFIAVLERNSAPTAIPYSLDPPVMEECCMRVAANRNLEYESESTTHVQHNTNNVNYYQYQAIPEQEYQYLHSENSFSTFPTRQY